MKFLYNQQINLHMETENTRSPQQKENSQSSTGNTFSQYLSFRFYKKNLDHLTDFTKDSINNFLKSIADIESEFRNTLLHPSRVDLHDLGLDKEAGYLEENY